MYASVFVTSAAALGLLNATAGPGFDWPSVVRLPASLIDATSEQFAFHGRQVGLPSLGRISVSPASLDQLIELREQLSRLLRPGETYLDLTNNSAHYFLLGYPVPVREANPYAAPAQRGQRRMLEQLAENRPPVVLAHVEQSTILHDGGPPSLRTPLIYRYLVMSYVPIIRGKFIFFVEPKRARDLVTVPLRDQIRLANVNDRYWDNGIHHQGRRVLLEHLIDVAGLEPGDELVFDFSGPRTVLGRNHEPPTQCVW